MNHFLQIGTLSAIFIIPVVGLHLVMGKTRILSLAQVSFFGVGMYAVGILTAHFHQNFLLAMLVGIICAGIIAFLLGLIFYKLREDYFLLGTIGFIIIFYNIIRNWEALTGGPYGIAGIPKPTIFGLHISSIFSYFIFSLVILGLICLKAYFIERSSFGRVLEAIRDDEEALQVFGYKTHLYKLAIFISGAMIAAVGGALYAGYISFIDLSSITITYAVLFWAMLILGGLGSLRGAIVGTIIIAVLPEVLRFVGLPATLAAELRQLLYGLVITLCMLFLPKGIFGRYKI